MSYFDLARVIVKTKAEQMGVFLSDDELDEKATEIVEAYKTRKDVQKEVAKLFSK